MTSTHSGRPFSGDDGNASARDEGSALLRELESLELLPPRRVALVLLVSLGVPGLVLAFCYGISGSPLAWLTLGGAAGALISWYLQRAAYRGRTRAIRLMAALDAPCLVSPLLVRIDWGSEETQSAVAGALVRLIPRMRAQDFELMTAGQRAALLDLLDL